MESLKILTLGGYVPWHPKAGGGQIIAYKLSEAIAKEGHNVDYVTVAPEEFQRELEWGNFMYLPKMDISSHFSECLRCLRNDVANYDVIHVHAGKETASYCLGYGIRKRFSKKIKLILGVYAPNIHKFPHSFTEACCIYSCKNADLVLSLSEFSRVKILKAYNLPLSKVRVMYGGADNAVITKGRRTSKRQSFSLLFCGQVGDRKGVDILLRAIPIILTKHRCELIVIGAGRIPQYKTLARKLRVSEYVNFTGFIEHDKLPEYYSNADLFVFPSRMESFGLVLVEAMASGLPIVSTRTGPIPEIIRDGENGILVPPNDPKRLAEAVNFLLSHPEKMRIMGEKGRARVERCFTWQRVAMNVIKLYYEVLEEKVS